MIASLPVSLMSSEDDLFAQAQDDVRAYCRWHIAPSISEMVRVVADDCGTLIVRSLMVTAVESVTDPDGNAVTGFTFDANGVISGSFTPGKAYDVALTHGYQQAPGGVAAVVRSLVKRGPMGGSTAVQVGQVRYATGSDGLPAAGALSALDRAALDPYRLHSRP